MAKFCCRSIVLVLAVAAVALAPSVTWADLLNVGTIGNESAWTVSTDNTNWYTPFQAIAPPGVSAIGLQQDLKGRDSMGNPEPAIGGLDLSNWNGRWSSVFFFDIPAGATDIHFHLNSLSVDDKAFVFLDGLPVGFFALNDQTGPGKFEFIGYPADNVEYISSQNYGPWSWDSTLSPGSHFIGAILNNTDSHDLSALSQTNIYGSNLYTYFSMDATVTFVPEPGAWMLLLTVAGFLTLRQIHRRS